MLYFVLQKICIKLNKFVSLLLFIQQHTGKELPMFSLGFYSVVELVFAMPSIVSVEREESHGDWTLYDARTHQPKPGNHTHGITN